MEFEDYADAFFRKAVEFCPDAFAPHERGPAAGGGNLSLGHAGNRALQVPVQFRYGPRPPRPRPCATCSRSQIGPEREFSPNRSTSPGKKRATCSRPAWRSAATRTSISRSPSCRQRELALGPQHVLAAHGQESAAPGGLAVFVSLRQARFFPYPRHAEAAGAGLPLRVLHGNGGQPPRRGRLHDLPHRLQESAWA